MSDITVFTARRVITMDEGRPYATAVAVREGRILSVGTIESMQPWLSRNSYAIDDTFADKIIMPGLIDPHTHLRWSGALTGLHYVGPIDSPDGRSSALGTKAAVLDRLRELDNELSDPSEPLFAWGYDPLLQGGDLDRDELDQVSNTRPLWILTYAIHFLYVNSAMLELLGADENLHLHGLGRYPDGRLNGQFMEMEATDFALEPFRRDVMDPNRTRKGLRILAGQARDAGITLTGDLGLGVTDVDLELRDHEEIVNEEEFPLRMVLVPAEHGARRDKGDDAVNFVTTLRSRSNDKLRMQGVKFWSDGAYQVNSLRVGFPGYLDGSNGLRGDTPWEDLADHMYPYWEQGLQIHAHANGDEAVDAVLDALAELQRRLPRFDHRFTLEHYAVSTPAQARRMKALGAIASVNVYLVHHRADVQNASALGPDRADATARLGSLAREGVVFGVHSDYALVVVPLHPLTAAWIAATRHGSDGTVLAPGERISREQALRAITIDSAYILNMEDVAGSIEVGKFADFAILEEDPTEVDLEDLKDIAIWGTVLGGVKHPSGGR